MQSPWSLLQLSATDLVLMQGTDPDYMWAVMVMLYWLKLACGVVAGVLSILWLVHVVLYVFLNPPLYGFLNTSFCAMDTVFPLFGTLAFAVFCFYLIGEHKHLEQRVNDDSASARSHNASTVEWFLIMCPPSCSGDNQGDDESWSEPAHHDAAPDAHRCNADEQHAVQCGPDAAVLPGYYPILLPGNHFNICLSPCGTISLALLQRRGHALKCKIAHV